VPQRAPAPTPQPTHKREPYQCEWCGRDGHLAMFCFRRLRFERRQPERRAPEVFHQTTGGHAPARCGQRRDARPRRVGGEGGGGGGYRAPGGGFTGPIPHRAFGGGQRGRGFGGRGTPRFPQCGGRQPQFSFEDTYPAFEQMARH
jgi:hypothetical protein